MEKVLFCWHLVMIIIRMMILFLLSKTQIDNPVVTLPVRDNQKLSKRLSKATEKTIYRKK